MLWDQGAQSGAGRWRLVERPAIVWTQGSALPSGPADYQLHFDTTSKQLWTHDPVLARWVGPPVSRQFGRSGTNSGAFFLNGPGSAAHGGSDRGHLLGGLEHRVLELHAQWGNLVSGAIEFRDANVVQFSESLAGVSSVANRNVAQTLAAGAVLQLRPNLTLGSMFNPTAAVIVAPLAAVT